MNNSEGDVIAQEPPPIEWNTDEDGNIRFQVTSRGLTCKEWKRHFHSPRFNLTDYGRKALLCASEAPTDGLSYDIVVRSGVKIGKRHRITKNIVAHAMEQGWQKPHWEVGCLIRDAFTDEQLEQMGLWYIAAMHEPVIDNEGSPCLYRSCRRSIGQWFHACNGRPDNLWDAGGGFAFKVQHINFGA